MFHEKRKNLIVTADDFGKSELANRNILALAKSGKLDRVSVMIDGDFAPEEIEELKNTGAKMDIHLELDWQKKRRDILHDSVIKQGIVFLKNYFYSGKRKKVESEWRGQIEKFRENFGCFPDGLNSHEYVHLFLPYFRIALKLAKEYSIAYVRIGKKRMLGKGNAKYITLSNLRRWDKKYFSVSKLDSSDFFVSLDWIENVDKFLENIPEGKTEIACHPERNDEFELIDKNF